MKCISPTWLKDPKGRPFAVPCGRCAWCRKRIRDQWVFRLQVEKREHMYSRFLTLTYRDEELPYSIDQETGVMVPSVSKEDVRQWLRRCWKSGYEFRYMVTAEYGSRTLRPHYHAVVFSNEKYDFIDKWQKGDNNLDVPAKDGSLKYIVKYMLKGSKVPEGALPNFHSESRRPGLGFSFVYKGEPYILGKNGVKLVPGHYYRRNYMNKLDSCVKDVLKDSTFDYLVSRDPMDQLRKQHAAYGGDEDFDTWLSWFYEKDNKKQYAINQKENLK